MRKLIIQIPCYNEVEALPLTLAELPRELAGFDSVEWLVIDDGSDDGTADVASRLGVDHVVRLGTHRGLAEAFARGLEACLSAGADVVVNTDADNQYCSQDIPRLLAPILDGKAEIVIGARPISDIPHFGPLKRFLQRIGSRLVATLSGVEIPDAPSGFRAFTRTAARELKVFNDFSYTLETIIQAGVKGIPIVSVPVRTNGAVRKSRLFGSTWSYIWKQGITIIRIFVTYRSFLFFAMPGTVFVVGGIGLSVRYLVLVHMGQGAGHVQSVIIAALLMGSGMSLWVVGLLADLVSVNRKLLEHTEAHVHVLEDIITARLRSLPNASSPLVSGNAPANRNGVP